jgi:hypothetical protein
VELEFVFSIFTTRVRKHFGNSGRFGPLVKAGGDEEGNDGSKIMFS